MHVLPSKLMRIRVEYEHRIPPWILISKWTPLEFLKTAEGLDADKIVGPRTRHAVDGSALSCI
jgi:hypothetical protein